MGIMMTNIYFISLTHHITYEDARDAEDAVYRMDRTRFLGREIEVEMARGIRKSKTMLCMTDVHVVDH